MTTTPQNGVRGAQQANDIPEIDNTILNFPNLVTLGSGVAQRLKTGVTGTLSARDDDTAQNLMWSVSASTSSGTQGVFGTFQFLQAADGRSTSWIYTLTDTDIVKLNAENFEFVPAKPDTVTLGAGGELRLTSKTPGAGAEAGDDIPQIHARLVIANVAQPSVVVASDRSGDEVNITITVAAGTTWQQVQNLINTGNLSGGSGTSDATEYVTASIDDDGDVGEPVDALDSTGSVKFDSALLVDADGVSQIRLIARRPGDGDFSTTDGIPEITFTLTKNAGATGFTFNDSIEGTLDITYNAGASETWAGIVEKINESVARPNSRQASNYISAALVSADDGSVAEPIAEVELTGALGVPDESVVAPFNYRDNFNKNGDIAIIFSSLLEPGDDRDIKVTLQRDSGRTDSVSVVSVNESNSEINITIVHGDGVSWIQLTKDVEAHSAASKYVVASLPYTSNHLVKSIADQLLHGNHNINIFAGFQGEQDQPQTAPLTDGMRATVDNSMPVFETLTGGADEVPPGDLTLTYTIRASDGPASDGGAHDEEDVTIIFSAENNAPNLSDSDTTENVVTEGTAMNTASATLEFRDPNYFEDTNVGLTIAASITEDGLTGDVPTTGLISEGSSNTAIEGMYGDFTLTRTSGTGGALGQIVWTYTVDEARASALPAYELNNNEPVAGTFGIDTLYVRVWDDDDASSEIRAVEVEVRGANAVPTVATASIAINGAGSITLTDENINFTDADAEDPASVIYTITAVPSGAKITRNDVELSVGGTFTHQDILDGWVTLDVSNANLLSGLRLTVDDDEGARSAAVSLDIQARDVVSIARPEASNNADYSTNGGNLVIDTGDFNDQIRAARGSDFITGGLGDDAINLDSGDGGGSGQDTVVYNFGSGSIFTATDGGDDITGFKRGEDIFLLKTVSDNPELATLDGLFSYVSGPNKGSSHDDLMIVRPNYEYESDGSGGLNFFLTGIEFHFEDGGVYGNGYLAQGRVSITFDERLTWNEFLSLIEIDNGDGGIDGNFDHYRGIIRDLSTLPNLMGEGSLAYERQGAILPIEIAPSGVNSVDETPLNPITQVQTLTQRTEVTYFVLNGVAAGDLRLVRVDPDRDQDPTGFFELDGNVLYLKSGISLDYDSTDRTLNVRVQDVNDSAVGVDVKVKVENVNDVAPVFISGTSVRFNPNNTVVYDAAATFDRTRLVWSLKEEDDYELLDINVDTGEVSFKAESRIADDTTYSFTVVATSGALAPVEQQVTIYPTGYTAPVIADTVGSIQDGEARRDNTPDAVSGAFMVTSGLDIVWESALKPNTTRYGTLTFTDDNRWEFELNAAGIEEINRLNAGETTQAIFNVTATNVVDSAMATLTIDLQGYSPTGAPVLRNDDLDVTVVVDSGAGASGQIGFTGDADGTAFATNLITPIGRHDTGSYRAVTNADGSTNIEGTYGILTLNHDGSWTYALDHDDTNTIALSEMPLPEDPRSNREVPIERTETFSLGYRSVDGGNAVDEVANINITVTNPGGIRTVNNFTQGPAYSFLSASGQVLVQRGTMTLDSDSFTIGIGNTRQRAIDSLDARVNGGSSNSQIRLILNLDQTTQKTHLKDGKATVEEIYGLFDFDFSDNSWTYTITESQSGRDTRDTLDINATNSHDYGDNISVPVYFAVQDITGVRLPLLSDGSPSADASSISIRGTDVIKHPHLRVRDETRPKASDEEVLKNNDDILVGRKSVTDNIDTGEGTNGVIGLGGDDNITLGNGVTFHPTSNTAVLDPQIDVVYHRVHFQDGFSTTLRPWRSTSNTDGKDTINNFIRNEDQFIFIEWTPEKFGVKLSEEQFLSNNALVFLTADIESVGNVFTLAGFKIGFARNGSDSITFNYHNDESKVALTNAEGILTTDGILAKYGLASTVRDGKHVIADNQQITGTEVRHNYFGDTNEDSFQIIHSIPNALAEFFV